MRPSDPIEKLFTETPIITNSDVDNVVLDDAVRAMSKSKQKRPVANKPDLWRHIMKSKLTKFAAAVVIVIAALIGINLLNGTPAWAEVLENISNAGNVVYKEISERSGHTSNRLKMVSQEGVVRVEFGHDTIMIMEPVSRVTLWLYPSRKEATRYGEPSPTMKTKKSSFIGWVKKLHEAEAEFVGREELDGQMTHVYVWDVPFETITAWVDPEINLPVKVEHKTYANTEKNIVIPQLSLSQRDFGGDGGNSIGGMVGSSRGSGLGISQDTTRTMYDFQWDVELDKSLFSLEPPEGYMFEQKYLNDSPIDSNSLVHVLGFWARMNDGRFPTEEQLNDPEAFKPHIIKAYDKEGDPQEELDQAGIEMSQILNGIYVVQEKKVSGSWGYAGQDIMLGQAEMIVCWWYDEEKQEYQAVLGDLSVVEVLEDQLPIQP